MMVNRNPFKIIQKSSSLRYEEFRGRESRWHHESTTQNVPELFFLWLSANWTRFPRIGHQSQYSYWVLSADIPHESSHAHPKTPLTAAMLFDILMHEFLLVFSSVHPLWLFRVLLWRGLSIYEQPKLMVPAHHKPLLPPYTVRLLHT